MPRLTHLFVAFLVSLSAGAAAHGKFSLVNKPSVKFEVNKFCCTRVDGERRMYECRASDAVYKIEPAGVYKWIQLNGKSERGDRVGDLQLDVDGVDGDCCEWLN